MASSSKINEYVNKRYDKWLDYAKYHCIVAGMKGEENDVLNEILLSLLQKDEKFLLTLLERKKDNYTELDWFVIKMINRNITSPSSPYKQKRICRNIDRNIDYVKLNIKDEEDEESDKAGITCERMDKVREVIEELALSPRAKQIFYFRFFCGENFKNWQGGESLVKLYNVYNNVTELVKQKINQKSLF